MVVKIFYLKWYKNTSGYYMALCKEKSCSSHFLCFLCSFSLMFEANGFIVLVSMYHTIRFSSLLLHFCKKKNCVLPETLCFHEFSSPKRRSEISCANSFWSYGSFDNCYTFHPMPFKTVFAIK